MAKKRKDQAAARLGRKGGKARARNLSKKELSRQGKHAAAARWKKEKGKDYEVE
ncbi:MAG TPA: hypothetical protein VKY85_07525 [Candidatus Angelobacter sp.]|nr:hypothetical protein [Candidatus Angelobacter sp.]